MTKENLRDIFKGAYTLLESKPTICGWNAIRAAMGKYTTSCDGFDYNRMRYDAVWMMHQSLQTGNPIPVKAMVEGFENLQYYYEQWRHNVALDAANFESERNEAMMMVKAEADYLCPPEQRQSRWVKFSRLTSDLQELEHNPRAQPFIHDLKKISATGECIRANQREYKALSTMIEDFESWMQSKEYRSLLSAYGAIRKTILRKAPQLAGGQGPT